MAKQMKFAKRYRAPKIGDVYLLGRYHLDLSLKTYELLAEVHQRVYRQEPTKADLTTFGEPATWVGE